MLDRTGLTLKEPFRYHPLYGKLLQYSGNIAMRQTWTMFSPSWKMVYKYEFRGIDNDGNSHRLMVPDLTKEYRESRSILNAVFFDFKIARILASYFHDSQKPYGRFRKRLADYYCARDEELFGIDLDRIVINVYTRPIPKTEDIESKTFDPLTAEYERTFFEDKFSCKES